MYCNARKFRHSESTNSLAVCCHDPSTLPYRLKWPHQFAVAKAHTTPFLTNAPLQVQLGCRGACILRAPFWSPLCVRVRAQSLGPSRQGPGTSNSKCKHLYSDYTRKSQPCQAAGFVSHNETFVSAHGKRVHTPQLPPHTPNPVYRRAV
jgi:hypothetical protein